MKNKIAWMLVLAMLLTLTACGTQAAAPEAAAAAPVSEEVSPALAQNPPAAESPAAAEASSALEDASEEGPVEEYDLAEVYAMAQRALDQQEIQNVMSRHVMLHCYGLHQQEVEELWVTEPENQATASFGQNLGYFVGYAAIWQGYVEAHATSWLSSAKQYCESKNIDISGMTDEEIMDVYGGVGQLLLHVTTTSIIEVAEDGQTAQCFWYSPGMVSETGQNANAIWEAYGVDFVKDIVAGLSNFFGGRSGTYEEELLRARKAALEELEHRARLLGANAVVGIDVDYEVLGADNGMLMVTASGTAVTVA